MSKRFLLIWAGIAFSLLTACDRQPVKANGSPVAPPPTPAQAAAPTVPIIEFKKAVAERPSTPGGACNFDTIAGKNRELPEISFGPAPLTYDAWAAVDAEQAILARTVVLQLVGASVYELMPPKTKRADVAEFFKRPGLTDAGFGGRFSAASVEPGAYELQVLIETNDGKWLKCGIRKKVTITSGA
jgi:hypothetical protein